MLGKSMAHERIAHSYTARQQNCGTVTVGSNGGGDDPGDGGGGLPVSPLLLALAAGGGIALFTLTG